MKDREMNIVPLFLRRGDENYKRGVLEMISKEIDSNGYFLSSLEKFEALGKSKTVATRNIGYLVKYGYLKAEGRGLYFAGSNYKYSKI